MEQVCEQKTQLEVEEKSEISEYIYAALQLIRDGSKWEKLLSGSGREHMLE